MHGPISYLPVRYPSNEEMEFCPMLDLTSQDEWDPTCIETLENGIIGISSFNLKFEDKIYNEMMFSDASNRLVSKVNVHAISNTTKLEITAEMLASSWNISIQNAKSTLQATTQNSVAIRQGHLHRRVKTIPHHLRYRHLSGYLGFFCSDTFKSNVKSLRGNKYTQLFCNRGNSPVVFP